MNNEGNYLDFLSVPNEKWQKSQIPTCLIAFYKTAPKITTSKLEAITRTEAL